MVVVGGWVMRFYCQHWDCFDFRFSIPSHKSQSQSLDKNSDIIDSSSDSLNILTIMLVVKLRGRHRIMCYFTMMDHVTNSNRIPETLQRRGGIRDSTETETERGAHITELAIS